jgi:small-conductance mechanosensitive channel
MNRYGQLLQTVDGETANVLPQLLPGWLQFPGHRALAALLVVVAGVWLSKLLVRLLGRPIARQFARQSVAQTVLGMVRGFTIGISVLVAGSIIGLGLSDIVLSVTVFSAVVGIILAPIVGNILNGIFVLADQPFEIGDMIELDDGTRGFVDDITIRYTKIFTLDNTFLVIPNGNVRERDVTNYSAEDERTRLTLDVLVTYESDIPDARRLMERAARDTADVIQGGPDIRVGSARYPANPGTLISDYGDNGIVLRLRYWVTKPYKIATVQSAVRTQIREQFAASDATVEMAYPHRHLVFDGNSGEAQVAHRAATTTPTESSTTQIDAESAPTADGPPSAVEGATSTATESASTPPNSPSVDGNSET